MPIEITVWGIVLSAFLMYYQNPLSYQRYGVFGQVINASSSFRLIAESWFTQ
ncbi:MAG: hypothetical protein PVJ68_02110 [Candidatus Thiodiazotropha sp.]|jgi:hypothetical protein